MSLSIGVDDGHRIMTTAFAWRRRRDYHPWAEVLGGIFKASVVEDAVGPKEVDVGWDYVLNLASYLACDCRSSADVQRIRVALFHLPKQRREIGGAARLEAPPE